MHARDFVLLGSMSWIDAVPAALVAVAWLVLPGLPVGYGLGLRGLAAWAVAPVVSVALVPATAMIGAALGVGWSAWPPIVVCAVAAALVGGMAFLLRQRFRVVRERDPRGVTVAALVGLLPAIGLGLVTVVRGFGRPDNLSQTYDALFHYNAIALILDSHNGSSLILSNFDSPDAPATFYPGAWHDFASLVVMTTGVNIPAAANALSTVVAIVLWPLACVFLARQIFGRSPAALVITGVLSVGFTAGPWGLLGFGVLWPNALGMAMIPLALGIVLAAVGLAKEDVLGRRRAVCLLPVAAVAATLAHPGALFTIIVLGVFPLGHAVIVRAWRLGRAGRTPRAVAEVLAVVGVLGVTWWWTATTDYPALEKVRETYWPPFESPVRAVRDVLLNATNHGNALWLLSALVVVGLLASLGVTEQRWLIPAHLSTGFLYLVAATMNKPETRKFTGYWYNDSFRLAAMLPVTGVPLAVAGILYLAKKVAERVPAAESPGRMRALLGSATAVALVITALSVVVSRGVYTPERTERLALPYLKHPPGDILATQGQRDFLTRARDLIPQDAVVANNPWDGSGLLWALADRRTLFPHFTSPAGEDKRYLATFLKNAYYDAEVCRIADRLHVGYLVIGDSHFWPWDQRKNEYPGFADPGSRQGFQLIAADGARKLYKITACTASPQVTG